MYKKNKNKKIYSPLHIIIISRLPSIVHMVYYYKPYVKCWHSSSTYPTPWCATVLLSEHNFLKKKINFLIFFIWIKFFLIFMVCAAKPNNTAMEKMGNFYCGCCCGSNGGCLYYTRLYLTIFFGMSEWVYIDWLLTDCLPF